MTQPTGHELTAMPGSDPPRVPESTHEKGDGAVAPTTPPDEQCSTNTNVGEDTSQVPPEGSEGGDSDELNLPNTEEGVARFVAPLFAANFRYDVNRREWFTLVDGIWEFDGNGQHYHRVRDQLKAFADAIAKSGVRAPAFLQTRRGIDAVVALLGRDLCLRVKTEDWDGDPMLAGTPRGVLDLETGCLRPATGVERVTKRLAVTPDSTVDCPTFKRFLGEVTGEDPDLEHFLLRWMGYILTGDTSEQSLLFIHGVGGNGKSVLVELLSHLLKDYGRTTTMGYFMNRSGFEHGCETAMLAGSRLVVGSETDSRHQWNETRVKELTGGDQLTARFMRRNPYTFRPQFKLIFVGNHKPRLVNPGPAMARRLQLVHFRHVPIKADVNLGKKLRSEAPAILSLIIEEGLREWREIGLSPPASVRSETEEYLQSEDWIGQALDDCFEFAYTPDLGSDKDWFVPTEQIVAQIKRVLASDGRGSEEISHQTIRPALELRHCVKSKSAILTAGSTTKRRGWFCLRARHGGSGFNPYPPINLTGMKRVEVA